jgi:endoglucanase
MRLSLDLRILQVAALAAMVAAAGLGTAAAGAAATFVDISSVANTNLEDDGIAGNGKGGWSDEGINDMFIYPPIPLGESAVGGYAFRILDPVKNGGKAVIMLEGRRLADKPEQVIVPVASVKGKFVYFLQNSVHSVSRQPANYRAATYTVRYADGTQAEIPVRDGIELRRWWVGRWYDNSGAVSWPIFIGRNLYSMKWNQFIAVYAMEWANPHADKPITSITLQSAGLCSPAIFAITIADDQFSKGPRARENYKRPPDVPEGYFDGKLAIEQERVFKEMVQRGMVEGIRNVEVIAPDLMAVTLDAVVARGIGMGKEKAEALEKSEAFDVTSAGDEGYKAGAIPAKVGRISYEHWNGDIGPFRQNTVYWHAYYLRLPAPLESGQSYTVTVKGVEKPFKGSVTLAYDEKTAVTPAIKVNQVAYSSLESKRYAYLGWWAGDLGKVDYAGLKRFQVIDEKTGRAAHSGDIALRKAGDKLSGEDVYQMDISALEPGAYHILVPGLGRSEGFAVGGTGIKDLYFHTMRAFYHQRCGQELARPFTDFVKPACHTEAYESGYLVGNPGYLPRPGEKVQQFKGGYHDAADFDVFAYHLRATAQALAAYECAPAKFKDGDLNIPESGNGIPDVLDEADWALFWYRDAQQADGGVPLGRGNDEDAIRDWESEHAGARPPFGVFPPEEDSSAEFAAVAAMYARLVRPHDDARAGKYIDAARKAYQYVKAHPAAPAFQAWAASELYDATGEEAFNVEFKVLYAQGALAKVDWKLSQFVPTFTWPYITCKQPGADKKIQDEMTAEAIRQANDLLKETEAPAYRVGMGQKDGGLGWGNGNGGGRWADALLRAYMLTEDRKYLDAACLNADFQLGANPLGKTFITGMGARPPLHPQISAFLYTGPGKTGTTVKGITVYGLGGGQPSWYPEFPVWRCWRDLGNGGAEISSEFTITETIGASAMLYAMLYALEP